MTSITTPAIQGKPGNIFIPGKAITYAELSKFFRYIYKNLNEISDSNILALTTGQVRATSYTSGKEADNGMLFRNIGNTSSTQIVSQRIRQTLLKKFKDDIDFLKGL